MELDFKKIPDFLHTPSPPPEVDTVLPTAQVTKLIKINYNMDSFT